MSAAGMQVKYNLLERGPESSGLLQRCADLDVTVVAHSPLSQGLLTGAAAGLLFLSSLQADTCECCGSSRSLSKPVRLCHCIFFRNA